MIFEINDIFDIFNSNIFISWNSILMKAKCINCAKFILGMLWENERICLEACQNSWGHWYWNCVITGMFYFNIKVAYIFMETFIIFFHFFFSSTACWHGSVLCIVLAHQIRQLLEDFIMHLCRADDENWKKCVRLWDSLPSSSSHP